MKKILKSQLLSSILLLLSFSSGYSQTKDFSNYYYKNFIQRDIDSIKSQCLSVLLPSEAKIVENVKIYFNESDAIRVQDKNNIVVGFKAVDRLINLVVANYIGNDTVDFNLGSFPGYYDTINTVFDINIPPEDVAYLNITQKEILRKKLFAGDLLPLIRKYLTFLCFHEIGHIVLGHVNKSAFLQNLNAVESQDLELDADDFALQHLHENIIKMKGLNADIAFKEAVYTGTAILGYLSIIREGRLITANELYTRQLLVCGRGYLNFNCKDHLEDDSFCKRIGSFLVSAFNKKEMYEQFTNKHTRDSLQSLAISNNNIYMMHELGLLYCIETSNEEKNISQALILFKQGADLPIKINEKYGLVKEENVKLFIETCQVLTATIYLYEYKDIPKALSYFKKASDKKVYQNKNFYNLIINKIERM